MALDLQTIESLDRLVLDLKIALVKLRDSGQGDVSYLFSHVRGSNLGEKQRAWNVSCMSYLSEKGVVIYDGSDNFVVLDSKDDLIDIIKDQQKTCEIAIKAYDSVVGTSIWNTIESDIHRVQSEQSIIDHSVVIVESSPIIEQSPTSEKLEEDDNEEDDNEDDRDSEEDDSEDEDSEDEDDRDSEEDDSEDEELSWSNIDIKLSGNEKRTLLCVREAIGKLISGDKLSRKNLFPEPCCIDVSSQRGILKEAVMDGLFQKEGMNRGRKYYLSPDRDDYDSISLIFRLIYPSSSDLQNPPSVTDVIDGESSSLLNGGQTILIENLVRNLDINMRGVLSIHDKMVTKREFNEFKSYVESSFTEILDMLKSGKSNGN